MTKPTKPTVAKEKKPLLRCVICGSAAAGVYYKVRSCDGCRSFFRRMVYRGQRNDACIDRENGTIVDCRAKSNCKKCRFDLCLRAGMRPWYLREATDVFFPFPLMIPAKNGCEISDERRCAALLHADIAHENMRLSKYEPTADHMLTLNSVLSTPCTPNDAPSSASNCEDAQASLRKKDRLSADLACSIEYIKAFEFFRILSYESKCAIILRSALVLTNFTSAFSTVIMGTNQINQPYSSDFRPIEVIHRISLSVEEASIVKALIVCNPAIEGIQLLDLPILQTESDEYGRILFALLNNTRGLNTMDVFIQAPVIYVEIMTLFGLLFQQAHMIKSQRLLRMSLGQELSSCPLLDDVMMS